MKTPDWLTRTLALTRRETWRFINRPLNTILPPFVTNALYISVFGVILGNRIGETAGFTYLQFVLPGLVVLAAISNAFQNSSFSLFHARWENYVDAVVASPMANTEQVAAYITSSAFRGLIVGVGVLLLGFTFTPVTLAHPLFVVAYFLIIVVLFAGLGLIAGMWASDFDQVTIFNQFIIRPLVFFGGVFYPLSDLPGVFRQLSFLNPMVYMVNGLRYGLLGVSEISPFTSLTVLTVSATAVVGVDVWLFRRGYGLTD